MVARAKKLLTKSRSAMLWCILVCNYVVMFILTFAYLFIYFSDLYNLQIGKGREVQE